MENIEDIKKIIELAEQNNAKAQCKLGYLYFYGKGVQKDIIKAIQLFKKSADLGYAVAEYNLGIIYQSGTEVTNKNIDYAVYWLTRAEEQGYQPASNALSNLNSNNKIKFE